MNKRDLKKGTKVYDSWWVFWGDGVVRKVTARRVQILFADGILRSYDLAHLQFLMKA